MNLSRPSSEVKIKEEAKQQNDHIDHYKCESEPITEPQDEVKIKIETLVGQKKQEHNKNNEYSLPDPQFSTLNEHPEQNREINFKRRRRNLSQYQRIEDVRSVATHFIDYGLNFRKFSQSYPDIDAKFYRNTVQAINNTAINEIEKYLRYECNIQIEKLNRDQKRSIRTQLTKVREWLGKKDVNQLQTLYKFIQRKYQLVNVDISIEQGLKFYKTILQIVKSPYVDVMEDDIKPQSFDPEINKQVQHQEKETQEKTLILLYIQHRNLTKVSDLLCEKFGYILKWSKHGVKQKIIRMIKTSLKKIIASVDAYDNSLPLYFSESNQCVQKIVKNEEGDNSMNMKTFLLEFYLQKTITLIELREYIRILNKFFILRYKDHGQCKCKKFEEDLKIPKLQIKGEKSERIVIEDSEYKKTNEKMRFIQFERIKQQKYQEKETNHYSESIKEQKHEGKDMNPVSESMIKLAEEKTQKIKKEKKEYILQYEECLFDLQDTEEQLKEEQIKLEA